MYVLDKGTKRMRYSIDRSVQLTNLQYQTRRDSVLELLSIYTKQYHDAGRGMDKYKKELAELDGKYLERHEKYLDKEYQTMKEIEANGTKTA